MPIHDSIPNPIRDDAFLYHLTHVQNLPGIFVHGLLPRSRGKAVVDVAAAAIVERCRRAASVVCTPERVSASIRELVVRGLITETSLGYELNRNATPTAARRD